MTEVFKDWLTRELDHYLREKHPHSSARVIYERVEETEEPEPGPSIYDIDLPDPLKRTLERRNIKRLYKFQYDAYRYILNGDNVIIVAGTGTGKTEAFFIPLAKRILEKETSNPRALLLYPTKALARDQVKRFVEYSVYGQLGVGIYDGDTPESLRRKIASSPPPVIVSNPDMIHVGLIRSPYVRRFVETAEAFVFDELHVYEGVLGSHLHHLVHRLKLTRDKDAQFIASSATVGNPKEFAESLFEEEFKEVRGTLTRRGIAVHVLISTGSLSRWSIVLSVVRFLADRNLKFVVFVDSQQQAEILANVIESRHGVTVAVHRAGLPHEVRRSVESKLREGLLQGVVATPTLELGVDIGALDAVVMVAPPPSYTKYLQRAGRAGRKRKGYVITVLGNDPIDSYYAKRPEALLEQELPPSVVEPLNEEVAKLHFIAYLLQAGRVHALKIPQEWGRVLDDLLVDRLAKRVGPYIVALYKTANDYVARRGSIRAHGEVVEIVDLRSNETIATRELPIAVLELYPGAIYFYMKKPYEVVKLDVDSKKAYVKELEVEPRVFTRPLYVVNVVDQEILSDRVSDIGVVAYAKVLLEVIVDSYVLKDFYSGETYATKKLREPVTYRYLTKATLIKIPVPEAFGEHDSAEAIHAIEHAIITASRITCGTGLSDLGGVSYPSGDVIAYDTVIGGSGASKLLYLKLEETLRVAYELMNRCDCEDGCPQCVYSPYCGNNNKVLSKRKAIYVLDRAYTLKCTSSRQFTKRTGRPIV